MTVFDLGALPDEIQPNDAWTVDDLRRRETYEWLWDDPRVRIRRVKPEFDDSAPIKDDDVVSVATWSGFEYCDYHITKRSCIIDRTPPVGLYNDCLALFHSLSWPFVAGRIPPSEAVARSELLDASNDGGIERVVVSQNDEGSVRLEVCFDVSKGAISAVTMNMFGYRGQPNEGVPTGTIRYTVQEWRKVDTHWIAWRAVREATTFDDHPLPEQRKPPVVHRIGMLRRSFEVRSERLPDSMFLRPVLPRGVGVADSTLGVGYAIGDTYVTLEGGAYALPNVVADYITPEQLARLLNDPKTRPMASSDP
jgi:hypothetical protein